MSRLATEPHRPVRSLEELRAIAEAVAERESLAYAGLAALMRQAGRAELAALFETLAAGVGRERRRPGPAVAAPAGGPPPIFDDEGTADASPELASAYGILAMAVRNAERAFRFWIYILAYAEAADVRGAAETLAHAELTRLAELRGLRRRAFHAERATGVPWTIEALERALADLIEAEADRATPAEEAEHLRRQATEARARADALHDEPLGTPRCLAHVPPAVVQGRACAELLLNCYLQLAEHLPGQVPRARAQRHAAALIDLLPRKAGRETD